MQSEYMLNDTLNIRELIETIADHIKTNGPVKTQPRTILSFLNILLSGVKLSGGKVENWISILQKVFSGNILYVKAEPLAEQICSGEFDNELLCNLTKITTAVSGLPGEDQFYQKLQQRVSLRFFSEVEKEKLRSFLDQKSYPEYLLVLLKHGFSKMYCIPCFFAERIYEEALTYDYDSGLRFALMREAAINGNKNAALEYGNYLAKSGPYEEAFEYLLLAAPLRPAVWNLAFLIENRWIGADLAKRCRLELKIEEKLAEVKELENEMDELDGLICLSGDHIRAEELLFVYKVYYYLAKQGFFKAYNSMAKMLYNGIVCFGGEKGEKKTADLYKKYTLTAIAGNNVPAMSNEGNRLLQQRIEKDTYDPGSPEERFLVELLSVASEKELMHACYYLGNYFEFAASHEDTGKTKKDIKQVYEHAAKLDLDGSGMRGQLYYRLGKLAEKREEQVQYFQKALSAGLSDAAYSLALCYCEYGNSDSETSYLFKASKLLEDNLVFMTSTVKEKAIFLQKVIIQRLLSKN